jgi:transposase
MGEMCLPPSSESVIPAETVRVARACFPKGNIYLRLCDELGPLYQDQSFACLFPWRGRPAEAPARLALVLVMQYAESLSDRQAAEAVRSRIDWKYALGLALTDEGFDASVLSEFRSRLVTGSVEESLLTVLLQLFQQKGLLKARGRQRTDSTHVLAAVHVLNRLELVGETLRQALESLAVVAPEWLREHAAVAWYERYGKRVDEYRLPKEESQHQALACEIGEDGFQLLAVIYAPSAPAWLRQVPAVETLRRVWLQQYYAYDGEHGPVRLRSQEDSAPAARRINSPHDLEAHYSQKYDTQWLGYKVHLTETCEPDRPLIITHVATTPATTQDVEVPSQIHADLAIRRLLPGEHIMDAGYVDAGVIVSGREEYQIEVVGPVRADTSWQARQGQGFAAAQFTVDWQAQQVSCPQGKLSREWQPGHNRQGEPVIRVRFDQRDCVACACRAHCTRAKRTGRELTLLPSKQQLALQTARQQQQTPAFKDKYDRRAGVEGVISQGTRVCGLRRCHYIGLAKTHLQHILTAAAINLLRVGNWFLGTPRARTRTSHFSALAQTVT